MKPPTPTSTRCDRCGATFDRASNKTAVSADYDLMVNIYEHEYIFGNRQISSVYRKRRLCIACQDKLLALVRDFLTRRCAE